MAHKLYIIQGKSKSYIEVKAKEKD